MPVYMVTGKLGGGKSLGCVSKIRDYLNQGRSVATNLDLVLEKLINPWAKNSLVLRLPDKPSVDDLENLPEPYVGEYSEEKSGLIVLDECGTWFNTRDYRDKSRQPLINKLLHIRKSGWDVMFIIQHPDMIDKQVREGIGEHLVSCQRTDRLALPFIGFFLKGLGFNARPPKMHLATVRYGSSPMSPIVDRWFYSGKELYDAYDTRQIFGANDCALHSVLPPYLVYGQYVTPKEYAYEKFVNSTQKISTLKLSKRFFFFIGCTAMFLFNSWFFEDEKTVVDVAPKKEEVVEEETVDEFSAVKIVAFIQMTNGFEYYFVNDAIAREYDPRSEGYKVLAIDECKAKLISANTSHVVTCR